MADITVCIATVAAVFSKLVLEYLLHFHGDERIVAEVADFATCCKIGPFAGQSLLTWVSLTTNN